MKVELPIAPEGVTAGWPGQFEVFSWLSFVAPLPTPLFVVTTIKPNGLANAALNMWGMFTGSGSEPKFLMTVDNNSDTCRLLKETGEFVVNLAAAEHRERLFMTTNHYEEDVDEVLASGFTSVPSTVVRPPRIGEAYAHFECVVEWTRDVEEQNKRNTLVMGRIVAAAMDEECMSGPAAPAFAKRAMPYFVGEYYDHAQRAVTETGWVVTFDLTPLATDAK